MPRALWRRGPGNRGRSPTRAFAGARPPRLWQGERSPAKQPTLRTEPTCVHRAILQACAQGNKHMKKDATIKSRPPATGKADATRRGRAGRRRAALPTRREKPKVAQTMPRRARAAGRRLRATASRVVLTARRGGARREPTDCTEPLLAGKAEPSGTHWLVAQGFSPSTAGGSPRGLVQGEVGASVPCASAVGPPEEKRRVPPRPTQQAC